MYVRMPAIHAPVLFDSSVDAAAPPLVAAGAGAAARAHDAARRAAAAARAPATIVGALGAPR